jgi:pimeloyl-ACP methyl ester carboxylesterase
MFVALVINLVLSAIAASPAHVAAKTPQPPYESFSVVTRNEPAATIAGYFLPANHGRANGTVIVCHGLMQGMEPLIDYQWMRSQQNWNVILFDFRGHGASSGSVFNCTLGYYEIWDLKAVVDWAEAHHLARPYLCYGVSMGASVALRWAGQDPRIAGVLAQSPYATADSAIQNSRLHGLNLAWLRGFILNDAGEAMVRTVDIPKAIAGRTDLVLWLTLGDRDWFPRSDADEILAASRSPWQFKRLIVIPNNGHGESWKWKPYNDQLIINFLNFCKTHAAR